MGFFYLACSLLIPLRQKSGGREKTVVHTFTSSGCWQHCICLSSLNKWYSEVTSRENDVRVASQPVLEFARGSFAT